MFGLFKTDEEKGYGIISPMNNFKEANKDKKLYGGEIVRVTVGFEVVELED